MPPRVNPARFAVAFEGGRLGAAELADRAANVAGALADRGVGPGDRVVACLGNGAAPIVLIHACRLLDAVVVPLNPRWSASELAEPAARTAPRAAVVDAVADPAVRAALATAAGGRALWFGAGGDVVAAEGAGVGRSAGGGPRQGADPLDASRARAVVDAAAPHPAWPWPPPPSPPLPQAVIFTSGTTGAPKGAVLTWGNAYANYTASRARLGHGSDDVWLAALPLHHVGGMAIVLRAAWDGAAVHVLPRFVADDVARAIGEAGVTIVSLVPSTLRAVLDAWRARYGERPAPDGFRALLLGGGPLAGAPVAEAAALDFPLAVTYGLTEAASQVATTAPGWRPPAPAAAPPLEGVRVRIAGVDGTGAGGDDAGPADRPIGDEGEIEVAGPTVFAGYWGDPAATARAMDGHWLRTGDLGRLDAEGRLHVVGRLDARIVTGGENVDPAEVEAVLDAHPAIGASCVVGVRDATWGHIVVAVIEPSRPHDAASRPPSSADTRARRALASSPLDAASLRTWLEGRLAGYKRPRRVVVVSSLPRTAAGKVRRAEAARLAQLDLDAADEARDGALREGREPPNAARADEG